MKVKLIKQKGGILTKLLSISTIFTVAAIVILSIISINSTRNSSMETATIMGYDKLRDDMLYFENLIENQYGTLRLRNRMLVSENDSSIHYDYTLVDRMYENMGGALTTIFVREGSDYRRVTTNIRDNEGKRMVDTHLGNTHVAFSSMQAGERFYGTANIFGMNCLVIYNPIFSPNTKDVIGILFIGIDMTKIKITISQNSKTQMIIISIIAVTILIILLAVNFTSFNYILIKPIKDVTAIIRKLSVGDSNLDIEESKVLDEIGTMKNELKQLVEGIKETTRFAQDIGEGNLDREFQPMSEVDMLGNSLLEMRKNIRDAETERGIRAKEEEERNWGTSGIAKFAEILRQDNSDLEALSYNIISNLVKYLGVNQGGIFILNTTEENEEKVLELKGCYAFDRKKFTEKTINPGEGLVGACYLEGDIIYITDVPENYINITSGLGDAAPKCVLICPLKVNNVIYGVIEFAAFEKLEPYKIDFVKKVSESIASTISTVRINIRTEQLLNQTRMQTEEMANAEEELRQNMEEMQATQEESRRREKELQEEIRQLKEKYGVV